MSFIKELPHNKQLERIVLNDRLYLLAKLVEGIFNDNLTTENEITGLIYNAIEEVQEELKNYE